MCWRMLAQGGVFLNCYLRSHSQIGSFWRPDAF
jgi:hypothetical protein